MTIALAIVVSLLFLAAWPAVFAAAVVILCMPSQDRAFTGGRQEYKQPVRIVHAPPLENLLPPYTYTLDTDLFPQSTLYKWLPADKWQYIPLELAKTKDFVDFAFILSLPSHRPAKTSLNLPARIRYRLSADEITDKVKLHLHMAGLHPKHIMRTFEMHEFSRIPRDHPVWIVRANWGWKGSATAIVSSTEELRAAYKKLAKNDDSRVIMSEYLLEPALRNGYKFHARINVVVGVVEKQQKLRKIAVMLPFVELILASSKYSADNFGDSTVHDTHYDPAAEQLSFDPTEPLYLNTVDCLMRVFSDLIDLVEKYPESSAAYDVFGVDMMYKPDGTPIIIEINKLPALGGFASEDLNKRHINELINGIMVAAVDPAFDTGTADSSRVISLVDRVYPATIENAPKTYLYVGDQLEDADVAAYLPDWRRITTITRDPYVDLIIGAGALMACGKLYSVRAHMKHRLRIKDIVDKTTLHHYLMSAAPDTIPETFELSAESTIPDGEAWIVRAGWGFDGQAVKIATNTAELIGIYNEFVIKNPKKYAAAAVIATRYIRNPMLINNRKFNVRVMMIAVIHSPEAVSRGLPKKVIYMLRKCNITTAVLPYVDREFSNPDIHITHGAKPTDPVRYHFHEGYPGDADAAMDRMQKLLTDAMTPLIDKIELYPESPAAYEILGADIIFDDTGRPYIVEINDVPGLSWLKMIPTGAKEYSRAYLDFIFAAIGGEFGMNVQSKYTAEIARVQ